MTENVTENVNISKETLIEFVDRLERLETSKKEVAEDMKEVYKQAKNQGFDVPAMKTLIKLRAKDAEDRMMEEEILEVYKEAVGLL